MCRNTAKFNMNYLNLAFEKDYSHRYGLVFCFRGATRFP